MVTLPPSDSSTQPLIGRVAVPRRVTTAVAPSVVPVSGTTDQDVMPGGQRRAGEVGGGGARDGLVGDGEPVEDAALVGGALVEGVGSVERGRVGGVEQAHAGELGRGDVDGAEDEQRREHEEAEREHPDLALVAGAPASQPGPPHRRRAATEATGRHTRSSSRDEPVDGGDVRRRDGDGAGTWAAMKSGTSGSWTWMLAR